MENHVLRSTLERISRSYLILNIRHLQIIFIRAWVSGQRAGEMSLNGQDSRQKETNAPPAQSMMLLRLLLPLLLLLLPLLLLHCCCCCCYHYYHHYHHQVDFQDLNAGDFSSVLSSYASWQLKQVRRIRSPLPQVGEARRLCT